MEHEMKISPYTIRRLRAERGWPQQQLALASGSSHYTAC
ncbi:MAG: transcriptional regulator with XRE-family HTH domain [Flavobacteriales bacterium]|jgi:transcriptional regulator with XRE-family HTH domain